MAEDNYYPLFKLLVERTRTLTTVVDNAAEVLSDDFKDMVTVPLAQVNEILAQCPEVGGWDGSFSEDDIIIEIFSHESQRGNNPATAVKIRHVPTDLSVESYSKRTTIENELVARKALAALVHKRWESEREAQERAAGVSRPRRRAKTA